jgi:hypothetical protein
LWLKEYNEERTHSGKYCFGKTPMQTFLDAKHRRAQVNGGGIDDLDLRGLLGLGR